MKENPIVNSKTVCSIFGRLFEFYPQFEAVLNDGDISDEVCNFLLEDLDDCYLTLVELKDDIHHV